MRSLRARRAQGPLAKRRKPGRLEVLESRDLLFGIGIHQSITSEALPFLKSGTLSDINDEHFTQDVFGQFSEFNHFDQSFFQESAAKLNERYTSAVVDGNPGNFNAGDMADDFGKNLHAIQDFYAHSNWVETQAAGLVRSDALIDYGSGYFNALTPYSQHDGVMTIQGNSETPFGPGSYLTRNDRVITVFNGTVLYPGIITASVNPTLYGDDQTPDSVAMSHGGTAGNPNLPGPLAKDSEGDAYYSQARSMAIQQTRHEFYRLMQLVATTYGSNTHLINAWVEPSQMAAFNTLMAQEAARTPDVTAPIVLATTPSVIHAAGTTPTGFNQIVVTFSESISALDGGNAALYELRSAGVNGNFGDGDDTVYALMASHVAFGSTVTLTVQAGMLTDGQYRLTIDGGPTTSIRDLSGLKLDGDLVGGAGGDYVRIFTIQGNSLPVLDPIGNQTVAEGSLLSFVAHATDPNPGPLTYSLGAGAPAGATIDSSTGLFTWTPTDNMAGTVAITIIVTDDGSPQLSDSETIQVFVSNVAPAAGVSGASGGYRGESLNFTFTANDPSIVDQAATMSYAIDWDGNGTVDQTVLGAASGVTVARQYFASNSYTVRVRATDKDGGQGGVTTQAVTITDYVVRNDGAGNFDLLWGGTNGLDAVFFLSGGGGSVVILTQFENTQVVSKNINVPGITGKVIANGYGFDDVMVAEFLVNQRASLIGGAGNDTLVGGFLADTLDGGQGNDLLLGGTQISDGGDSLLGGDGDDVLIGYAGADTLRGGNGTDLLIADGVLFSDLPAAVLAIHAEWSLSGHSYADRVANISGVAPLANRLNENWFLTPNDTLIADGAVDQALGENDLDWFVYTFLQDATDRDGSEDEWDAAP
jgi:hypothetical protein